MRILFVGWPVCVHTVRWIENLPREGFELHFYAWDESAATGPRTHERVRKGLKLPRLANVTTHYPAAPGDAAELARFVETLRPDVVHSMPVEGASVLAGEAKKILKRRFPPWFVSAWGMSTELLFGPWLFGLDSNREDRVAEVLRSCDFLFAESPDDVARARALGFRGEPLLVGTVAGGFALERYEPLRREPPSRRRWVLLKGYQHFYGRALTALKAFELCADELKGFRIGVCAAAPSVELAAGLLRQRTGLEISCLPFVSYDSWLKRLGKARVSVGNNLADGRPNAMGEAMLMGALPIQSNTAYTKGWIRHGRSGFVVPHDDPAKIATALRRALTDDALVDAAAETNFATIRRKLSLPLVRRRIVGAYRQGLEA